MKAPIFVFTDDLDVFRSVEDAEGYFEGWILDMPHGMQVFDSEGVVLKPVKDARKVKWLFLVSMTEERVCLKETDEINPIELRKRLIERMQSGSFQERIGSGDLINLSLEEIIQLFEKYNLYT